MASAGDNLCPVCRSRLKSGPANLFPRAIYYQCPKCGQFGLTASAEAQLFNLLATPRNESVLSYAISKAPRTGPDTPVFDFEDCNKIVEADFLPTPQEQAENLIRWLGDHLGGPGEMLHLSFPTLPFS